MSDAIAPALTAEEWRFRVVHGRNGGAFAEPHLGAYVAVGVEAGFRVASFEGGALSALMALANAALPDGDPRKLTRDDVAACRAFDFQFYGAESDSVLVARAECDALQRLATKLAALLPPEGA